MIFEVTDRGDENAPGAQRVVLSVPVQVGKSQPVLRCPTSPVTVPQGGSVDLDIAALCHPFTTDPDDLEGLAYSADWDRSVDGLSIIQPSGTPIVVAADSTARAGSEALLLVWAGNSEPGRIRIRVGEAAAPRLAPIQISGIKPGESRIVDLGSYLTPGVADPVPTVLGVTRLSGRGVTVSPSGGSQVRITAGSRVDGHAEFRVVMSDVARGGDPRRRATNVLSLDLLGVPETPRPPVPGSIVRTNEVHLTWVAPAANGAPINSYEVRASDGTTTRCPTTSCDVTGLTNGTSYTFTVRAHNAVGWSDFSARSRPARPDAVPGPVRSLHQSKTGDGQLTIAWKPPSTINSPITSYRIVWAGGRGTSRTNSFYVSGLDNDKQYSFTVYARNAKGEGPGVTGTGFQSQGQPGVPEAPVGHRSRVAVGRHRHADGDLAGGGPERSQPGVLHAVPRR